MDEVIVSAPGKVILHGEHSVVYGKAAVATGVNLRAFLRLSKLSEPEVRLHLPDVHIDTTWSLKELEDLFLNEESGDPLTPGPGDESLLEKLKEFSGVSADTSNTGLLAVIAFLYLYSRLGRKHGKFVSMEVTVASTQPVGAGLGSSASYSVCLATSLLTYLGVISPCKTRNGDSNLLTWSQKEKELINAWAFEGERIIHGKPSGIDNSMATYGGALKFQSGKIEQLDKMPRLRILLTNTKVPRSTKILVAGVRQKYERFPEIFSPVFEAMHELSLKGIDTYSRMAEKDTKELYNSLEELIDINQDLLRLIGVSHPMLELIVKTCQSHSVHSKLTGAGGGGCAFSLLTPDTPDCVVKDLVEEFSKQGFDCWETSIGGDGVLFHKDLNTQFTLPPAFR